MGSAGRGGRAAGGLYTGTSPLGILWQTGSRTLCSQAAIRKTGPLLAARPKARPPSSEVRTYALEPPPSNRRWIWDAGLGAGAELDGWSGPRCHCLCHMDLHLRPRHSPPCRRLLLVMGMAKKCGEACTFGAIWGIFPSHAPPFHFRPLQPPSHAPSNKVVGNRSGARTPSETARQLGFAYSRGK